MPALGSGQLSRLEERILTVKSEIGGISRERWEAALRRDDRGMLEARKRAAARLLENCEALAEYVAYSCPNVARDILGQGRTLRSELEKVKKTSDHEELHKWYKTRLVPLVKHSEAIAHVAATSRRKRDAENNPCYQWPLSSKLTR